MEMSIKKTKVICASSQKRTKIKILIGGHRVEEVDEFEYLVIGLLTGRPIAKKNVRNRIAIGKKEFLEIVIK